MSGGSTKGEGGSGIEKVTDSYIAVTPNGTPSANGTALVAVYAAAKLLTPNGNALSATNRASVLILPGTYGLTSGQLVLDAEFVDLIGVGNNQDIVLTSPNRTVSQTADNVQLKNFTCETTVDGETMDPSIDGGYWPDTDLPNTLCEDMRFLHPTSLKVEGRDFRGVAMRTSNGIEYSGTYKRCYCQGGWGFAGYHGLASGWFEDCYGTGDTNFSGEITGAANEGATGVFIRCYCEGDFGFGGEGGIATGYFEDCVHDGTIGFAGEGAATGTFIRCKGGSGSFGSSGYQDDPDEPPVSGFNNGASGYFEDCIGGRASFGGFYLEGAFGGMRGTMVRCQILSAETVPTFDYSDLAPLEKIVGGKCYDCRFGGNLSNQAGVLDARTGSEFYGCNIIGDGTGKSIDTTEGSAQTITAQNCNLPEGIGANITISGTNNYNAGIAE